jgi:hypothetical protein
VNRQTHATGSTSNSGQTLSTISQRQRRTLISIVTCIQVKCNRCRAPSQPRTPTFSLTTRRSRNRGTILRGKIALVTRLDMLLTTRHLTSIKFQSTKLSRCSSIHHRCQEKRVMRLTDVIRPLPMLKTTFPRLHSMFRKLLSPKQSSRRQSQRKISSTTLNTICPTAVANVSLNRHQSKSLPQIAWLVMRPVTQDIIRISRATPPTDALFRRKRKSHGCEFSQTIFKGVCGG